MQPFSVGNRVTLLGFVGSIRHEFWPNPFPGGYFHPTEPIEAGANTLMLVWVCR